MTWPERRVAVIGGYGVFGSLLCELLTQDGHHVWVAGRTAAKAQEVAARIGAEALAVDRTGDLSALWALGPDVVIDAAGPFHAYDGDPYALVRACLEAGVHYLDLSDDAAFTAGITALEREAQAAGRVALSGVSSVPGISSVVAAHLSGGLTDLRLIESAILPGNRAPRGLSVIASILNQMGRPMQIWRGGAWREVPAWSGRRLYDLDSATRRAARLITVPDLALFPKAFGARSVLFRAGMELRVMNLGLVLFGWLRRAGLIAPTDGVVWAMQWVADRLEPFGSDLGSMVVDVVGDDNGQTLRRRWRLIAEAGRGPYIPGIAARTIVRQLDAVPPGARACVAEVSLPGIEEAMSDLSIRFEREDADHAPLFQRVLGSSWAELPAPNRRLADVHDVEVFTGRARIDRGTGWLVRLGAALFGFPPAGDDVPVTVTKTRHSDGEVWERDFAGRRFRSHLTPAGTPGRVFERFGPVRFELDLPVRDGAMQLPVLRGWVLGVPIPGVLLPISDSREYTEDGVFHFDVGLIAPLGLGLVVRYRGWLKPDGEAP
ncbi:MAG: DUF4166 domain-containing protein [Pseudomonadota bacterium]